MLVYSLLLDAARSMNANRLRTGLTMLGIIIGITSVVVMLAVGDSMQRFVRNELQVMGTNMMFVTPGNSRAAALRMRADASPSLTMGDAEALNSLPGLAGAAPELQGSFKVSAGNESSTSVVRGVSPAMFNLRNWKVDIGSVFSEADVRSSARTAVIGRRVADQFFYKTDPVGKIIRIENVSFEVIGVLSGEGKQVDGPDLSETVIVPISTARAHFIRLPFPGNVHKIVVQAKAGGNLQDSVDDINEMLRDRHHIKFEEPDDFAIANLATFAETGNKIGDGIAVLLGLIGAISLVVGGIGIMNIMLVSVTERTREIGIRMAIGAKPADIMLQFLAEAVLICVIGGLVGICIATLCAFVISSTGQFVVSVSPSAIAIACAFSGFIGIFFGFYPARRASRLLPVECLRYE